MHVIDEELTAEALGGLRLITSCGDWAKVNEWIAAAPPKVHAEKARRDPHSAAYAVETIVPEIAQLAGHAICWRHPCMGMKPPVLAVVSGDGDRGRRAAG
jgi:hypothetical protein